MRLKEKKQRKVSEAMLWKVFSEFIRLRDADENGICRCFTCGAFRHWKSCDAGHGIPRQYKATKYNEKNNHAQCKICNGMEGGKREVYRQRMNERYGENTWELMQLSSKQVCKRGSFEREVLYNHYKIEVEKLKKQKQ